MIKLLSEEKKHASMQGEKAEFEQALSLMETAWASAVMLDHMYEVPLAEWSEMIGVRSETGYSVVFALADEGGELSGACKRQVYNFLKRVCKQKASCVVGPMSGSRVPVFVMLPDEAAWRCPRAAKSHAVQFAGQIIGALGRQFGQVRVHAGIGTCYSSIKGLAASYQEALTAADKHAASAFCYYGDAAEEARGSNDPFAVIRQAKEYIDANYTSDLSLEQVAEAMGLKPQYFSRLFKTCSGITFIDYLTQLRIEKAKDMMGEPHLSLKCIGRSIGYRDPNYFSRVFRKTVGVSPSQFREQHGRRMRSG
ncbi:helix-turn-helix domain-containing protein [Paenibacillaceae bacterium WGS1546]|uniref:helix-turn-helix domain-containing protein n=1 Tax=Cohnella sp. WGS1546 TaxID=3366810 RepID=UPI00372D7B36